MTVVLAFLGVVGLPALWMLARYRGLTAARTGVDAAWAQVEDRMHRRNALVLQAAEAAGETGLAALAALREAQDAALGAGSHLERAAAERRAQSRLREVVELGLAVEPKLASQLMALDGELRTARRVYNAEVRLYRTRRRGAPAALLRRVADFPDRGYFELDHTARERPGAPASA